MNSELFNKYVKLYEAGTSIKDINPIDNQTYKILSKSNIDVRIIDRDLHLAEISSLNSLKHFSKDTEEYSHRFFYAIPLQTVKGTIVGFIFRSVFGKNYTTINRDFTDKEKKVPIMFGFYKDFETFDNYKTCKPIIVCEGLKDCITLKKIYPYVLANNTSSMGINLRILGNLTDKFILIYDNDEAGQNGMARDTKNIDKLGYNVLRVSPPKEYKDCADCYENRQDFIKFADEVKDKIRSLISGNDMNMNYRNLLER